MPFFFSFLSSFSSLSNLDSGNFLKKRSQKKIFLSFSNVPPDVAIGGGKKEKEQILTLRDPS